ncbi:MAG: serine/threonine protein kinase [Candidatus Abyssobacteria bacterium SURF_17]|uniref:Serine/threonine protein kinase n=1 Tax=Candidatus Abyssobacteria bacterium SURF_17 TaxID=2093361 RepID=A0A419F6U7_9BACT|nr:MAG: serine/threonine protein kinase [Candidatus Abyssubacteria bacterium SURF_17]
MIGTTISHYKIIEKLGEGGRSVVYKAVDMRLERTVALKVLSEKLHKNQKARLRFLREAQAVAQLDHPNICTVYETDQAEGLIFIVMACVEGQSLTRKLEIGPLEVNEVVDISLQTAHGLLAAHKNHIIHRDIKDGNIMINTEGVVKILDFGLAKLLTKEDITRPRAVLGTVPFMSPEQAVGKPVDIRTDIWSLGVVMYRMLTGVHPFKGRNVSEMIKSILDDQPARIGGFRSDMPEPLEACIQKMLSKGRQMRHENMGEVIKDLQRVKPS